MLTLPAGLRSPCWSKRAASRAATPARDARPGAFVPRPRSSARSRSRGARPRRPASGDRCPPRWPDGRRRARPGSARSWPVRGRCTPARSPGSRRRLRHRPGQPPAEPVAASDRRPDRLPVRASSTRKPARSRLASSCSGPHSSRQVSGWSAGSASSTSKPSAGPQGPGHGRQRLAPAGHMDQHQPSVDEVERTVGRRVGPHIVTPDLQAWTEIGEIGGIGEVGDVDVGGQHRTR